MTPKPALSELPIKLATSGFYRGFSVDVTVVSKIIISALVVQFWFQDYSYDQSYELMATS